MLDLNQLSELKKHTEQRVAWAKRDIKEVLDTTNFERLATLSIKIIEIQAELNMINVAIKCINTDDQKAKEDLQALIITKNSQLINSQFLPDATKWARDTAEIKTLKFILG